MTQKATKMTPEKETVKGLSVAFLGIDNAGKTTIMQGLRDKLRGYGIPVAASGWRSYVNEPAGDVESFPVASLRQLWVEKWRLLAGGAGSPEGDPIEIPAEFDEFLKAETEDMLNVSELRGASFSGPLAASWLEVAANLLVTIRDVRSLTDSGFFVLQESFGFKQAVKEIAIAAEMAPTLIGGAEETYLSCLIEIFGTDPLRPDVGVFVRCSPTLACTWRMGGPGRFGILEDLTLAGEKGPAGFVRLQRKCDEIFERAARSWGWPTLEIVEDSLAGTVERGVDYVLALPKVRDYIESMAR